MRQILIFPKDEKTEVVKVNIACKQQSNRAGIKLKFVPFKRPVLSTQSIALHGTSYIEFPIDPDHLLDPSPVKGLFKLSLSLKPLESETNSFCSCSISGHSQGRDQKSCGRKQVMLAGTS